MSVLPTNDSVLIREVWNDNLEYEFSLIRELVDDYPYVAMDTEFPGVTIRLMKNESLYSNFKANVDTLKLIQVGLTFSDEQGNLPTCGTGKQCIWQFSFREFNVKKDAYAHDSVALLNESGIDFDLNNQRGVDACRFGELLMSSGVVLNDNITWITFQSNYDFGYLIKNLTCRNLPYTKEGFLYLLKVFFPVIYDIKHLMKYKNHLHGGLSTLAATLGVQRVGVSHQAGSDSLLTCCTFMKLRDIYFDGSVERYSGVLYGFDKS